VPGGVTKTFRATVLRQLAAERRIALDDPIASYAPGVLPRVDDDAVALRCCATTRAA
jgi:D-alanyl-D-alanine carboxypeptidase